MSLTDIKSAASDLDERERAALAIWLLQSLPPPCREDESEDIVEEAERRREQLRRGEAKALSSEEFWASIESSD